jgi:NAD(P)-dependent dehydrogenase (short-subunit alcohol dehydrogenase family)
MMCSMTATLQDKIIVITGASRGIGAGVAKRLAQEGAHCVLCARDVAKLEAVDDTIQTITGKPATIVPLDVLEGDKIDALGAGLLQKFGRVDGFIGNAAILGQVTPLTHHDPKLFERVMAVNVTANWRMLRILHPLLKQSATPRVALVTSGITAMTAPFWGAYAASKHALESLAMTYAEENNQSHFRVNLIDPHIVATNMRAQAFPSENKSVLLQPDDAALTDIFVRAMSADAPHALRLMVD